MFHEEPCNCCVVKCLTFSNSLSDSREVFSIVSNFSKDNEAENNGLADSPDDGGKVVNAITDTKENPLVDTFAPEEWEAF